ncbi:TonB-dependent receptor [Croceicoccus naphthovorans]|uniref:TonB-dependent receptor n=2 Tax=Croceicoccus naphthovorans TaxID=1348774 RepID=A0A0G3XFH6_9SPHN|nr:TonB-dependent receptor [Croceicoccus naphthovorans]
MTIAMPALAEEANESDRQGQHSRPDREIIVTAHPLSLTSDETATPVISLEGDDLVHRAQSTLGDTLAGMPGINVDNFGGGAGRPVIRGQTSPRVQSLSDGSNIQDASAISPDHAVTTEPLLLSGIEVLRGPSALIYGGSAIGGAVNLLDEKVPTNLPEGGITGAVEGRYGTSDNEQTGVGGITASIGQFALRLEGVRRQTDDYEVPGKFGEAQVDGSWADTSTITVGGSWISDNGYVGLAYTRQHNDYGLPGHNHAYEDCHPHGGEIHCGTHDEEDDHEHDHEEEGHEDAVFTKLRSERVDFRGEYRDISRVIERVRFRAAFTDYSHSEIEEGDVATTFTNKAHDMRFELTHARLGGLRGTFGVQHSHTNFKAIGEEQFLPPSKTDNTALFLMESFNAGPLRFELAARHEWQTIKINDGRKTTHRPFSVSGAAIWDIDGDYSVALSIARSQRAPNVQELFANTGAPWRGIHLATNTWEIGTPTLGKETGKSVDLTVRKTAGDTTFTLGLYHQDYDNYIFAQTLDQFEDFRLIRYMAGDARFTGIDGDIRHQVTPNVGLAVFGDYVRAKLKDGGGNLPRIPAGRLGGRVDGVFGPLYGDVELYQVFEQGRIASFETRTSGYTMINATLAYSFDIGERANAELFLRGTNLANELAYNHASFIKDAAPLRGRSLLIGLRAGF